LNFTSISRAKSNPEQRTRSQQTSTAQQASLASPVDNPEQLLHRRHRRTGTQAVDPNLESNTLGFAPPMLGSPSDIEPNPFLDHNANSSGPIVPGWFRLAIPTMILEESFIKHNLDSAQHQANSNPQLSLTQSNTPTLAPPIIQQKMPLKTQMPTPLSPSAPKWDRQTKMLRNFLRIVEQLFRLVKISNDRQKLNWLISYIEADIANQWSSFPEFETGPWNQFPDCLKIEYPELTSEEQGMMGQLHRLCREYSDISLLDEEWLMEFKQQFMYIAQKCLKSLAITGN